MSETLNVNVLVAAKEEYSKQLINCIQPSIYDVLLSIFEDSQKNNIRLSVSYSNFQKELKAVPHWADYRLEEKISPVSRKFPYLMDLITAIFVSHVKILACVRLKTDDKSVKIKVPSLKSFLHKIIVACSEQIYYDPQCIHDEKVKMFKLTEQEIEDCILAGKAVDGHYVAVDFIPAKNREKEAPFVIEVNSSPGTEGMEEASGQNISKEIIEFFADSKNWVKVPSECGYKEVVTIKPFGEIVAKFDTGNSGMSVIHAEKIKVNGKKVTWSLLGKTITSDIIRKEEISVGGLRDYDEDRYVVKLQVEFLGSSYETEFTLDDRDERTHILFDRDFMNRLNVMVNPGVKYVVTTKYSLD